MKVEENEISDFGEFFDSGDFCDSENIWFICFKHTAEKMLDITLCDK